MTVDVPTVNTYVVHNIISSCRVVHGEVLVEVVLKCYVGCYYYLILVGLSHLTALRSVIRRVFAAVIRDIVAFNTVKNVGWVALVLTIVEKYVVPYHRSRVSHF
jgi:hypothetical protein